MSRPDLTCQECQQFVALALCFHQPAAQPATIVPPLENNWVRLALNVLPHCRRQRLFDRVLHYAAHPPYLTVYEIKDLFLYKITFPNLISLQKDINVRKRSEIQERDAGFALCI